MTIYDVDFTTLVKQLMPVRLRQSKMVRWLQCLIVPVIELYQYFTANRSNNLYWLGHNGQVVYLQAVLNDIFDPISRRIYIDDGGITDPLFVYLNAETTPLWLGKMSEAGSTWYPDPQWLFTTAETTASGFCFVIKVPTVVVFDTYRLRALVDKYRLPSKANYSIVLF